MPSSAAQSVSYGQVIEYIQDRLYLASYTHAPSENTPFPYPAPEAKRSPKKSSRAAQQGPTPVSTAPRAPPVYFTIDDSLLYNAFHHDFGPLHIGHLYRFAVQFHEILGDPANSERAVVFWSRADSRSRANAACLVACYMVLIQAWPPHLALAPIAQADPPYMPFRDAGYSQADFILNIQDIVYGVWKAKEENLCVLKEFNLEEYERFERVDMGDFNWISPQFLAFASPQSQPITPIPSSSPAFAALPSSVPEIASARISQPFKNVLTHFVQRNIGLVVRLNSELYCPSYFTALGINHIDMIFEDGTCPPLPLVRKFIKLAHDQIARKKGIAVHCKAGLGRTGCLIGAYLIYRHGFTANEVIAFMRFMRPGMVVGPQQHWLHLNQGQFREWYLEDQLRTKLSADKPVTPRKISMKTPSRLVSGGGAQQMATPPQRSSVSRAALGEIDGNDSGAATNNGTVYADENLPAPTPGQPRKYARMDPRHHPYSRSASGGNILVTTNSPDKATATETEVVTMQTQRQSVMGTNGNESEEELILQKLAHRRSQSRSPNAKSNGGRSVSYTTTTTTMTKSYDVGNTLGIYEDSDCASTLAMENMPEIWDELAQEGEQLNLSRNSAAGTTGKPKTPRGNSGNGSMSVSKTRSGVRDSSYSPRRSGGERDAKVRKTSGRVGSAGYQPVAVKAAR